MNDFNINGYFGAEARKIKAENCKNHKQIFQYCKKLIRFSLANTNNIHYKDERGLFVYSLYLKIINAFQSSIIMCQFGFDVEARVVTRTSLESLFCLKAIIDDDEVYDKFIDDDMNNREGLYKMLLNHLDIFTDLNANELHKEYKGVKAANDAERAKLKEKEEQDKSKKEPTVKNKWYIAEKADMTLDYDTAYNIFSDYVHPNFRNLQNRYMILNQDKNAVGFNTLPSTLDIGFILYTNCYLLIHALDYLIKYFSLSFQEDLQTISDELNELVEKK